MIASAKSADKVVFLMDRIELGTQSLKEYRNFADADQDVQATENTGVLVAKLKSLDPADALIVTSIQKMSNISDDAEGLKAADLEKMKKKRIVFIVDECHRSTFGEMMLTIKQTFPRAIFFGFTGTPIQDENIKKGSTTSTVFGDELHRYSIADGIRDRNVLGFDTYKVLTFKDADIKRAIALEKAKAKTEEEAFADPGKSKVFQHYTDLPMAGHYTAAGDYVEGIEDYLPNEQYETPGHREKVVEDILENWTTLSRGGKFHAIFATNSIREAILYYRLFKQKAPEFKVSALFDPNIDNSGGDTKAKEEGLVEIIDDYNRCYGQTFDIPTFAKMKKDMAARLAHKKPYEQITKKPQEGLDLMIVVDQMLTGYDSKWVNTLYLDKILKNENLIQAFSRTNRLFGAEKPHGVIKYYRRPHTMERLIEEAVKLYSGNKPLGLFVQKLDRNLSEMNKIYGEIKALFENANIQDLRTNPTEPS